MAVEDRLGERLERAHAVVPAGGCLQQPAARGRLRVFHAADERRGERLRAGDERGEPRVAVGALGVLCERLQVGVRCRIDLGPRGRDHRLVEAGEPHLPREIGYHRVATVRRGGQPVERRPEVRAREPGQQFRLLEATVEDREHGALHGGGALLGQEKAIARLLQCRRAVEGLDPVVAQRQTQLLGVVVREAGGQRIARAQEGVQMLLRAAHQLALILLVAVPRPGERTELRELREQAVLTRDEGRVAGHQVRALAVQVAGDPLDFGGVDVEAEHRPFEALEVLAAALRRDGRSRAKRRERDPLASRPAGSRHIERLELQQRRVGGDVDVRAREHMSDAAPNGATSDVSIFMLSTTAITSPASTSSPGATGIDTTMAGARLRTIRRRRGRCDAGRR